MVSLTVVLFITLSAETRVVLANVYVWAVSV